MRVYEPKRSGNLELCSLLVNPGAVVYRHGTPIAEFDYANEAVDFVQRQRVLGIRDLRIVNPHERAAA